MKGILKLYSQYGDKIIIIPVLCIILYMVTYFIHIITKKSRFPKYLPGLAFIKLEARVYESAKIQR